MSTALYRRYRPETFADVIGQEHVTEPLMQALRTGRVHHAYLFSGPRGCGKTTSARILARCLNCAQGPTPEPCGTCESCVALARGGPGTIDVVEIDAASHGGVDDARDLRERAAFGPAQAQFKVYIIDEAHMVTTHGFNALLKVVEEPPAHVKFIFATTEPDKVLSTIRSRTHHYPFHLVPPQRLTTYLEQVCATEEVDLEPGVLSFVTRAGGGSVRDTLSVLDQLISGAGPAGLSYERTAALLGFTDSELLDAVVDSVAAGDAASVFRQVDKVMESGHDPRRFVEDLVERYRDLIVIAAVGEHAEALLPGVPRDQVDRMRHQASSHGVSSLTRCADVVSRGLAEMTGAVSYRLLLELICARLLLPGAAGEQGYAARLDRIERRLSAAQPVSTAGAGSQQSPAPPSASPQPRSEPAEPQPSVSQPSVSQPSAPQPSVSQPSDSQPAARAEPVAGSSGGDVPPPDPALIAGGLDTGAVRRRWPEVLDAVKGIRRVTWSFVSVNTTVLDYDGERLLLQIATAGQADTFRRGNHAEVVRQALIEAIGLDTRVESTVATEHGAGPDPRRGSRGRAPSGGRPESAPAGGAAPPSRLPDRAQPGADRPEDSPSRAAGRSEGEHRPTRPEPPPEPPEPEPADWAHRSAREAPSWAGPPAATRPPVAAPAPDSTPSEDDEDLDTSGTVGQPVIESVLGGTVIAIDDAPAP